MIFFVDTNFFLQCKKYDQLPWNEITDDTNITILISRPVQTEIDRLKNDGNSRRARETTKLFHEMLNADNLSFQLATKQNEITLLFAKNYSVAELQEFSNGLDMARNDDQILATVRKYISDNNNDTGKCFFLTNDTNPLLTAKMNGIPSIQIPGEWLLQPENDERDKKITDLEKQIQELQDTKPQISLVFSIHNGRLLSEKVNEYEVTIDQYVPIEKTEIDELADSFYKKHPKKTCFDENRYSSSNSAQTYCPPTEKEVEKYNSAYNNWKDEIYSIIDNYATNRNKKARAFCFTVSIENKGNVPAKGCFVDFSILTGGSLAYPGFKAPKKLPDRPEYPAPPDPPNGTWKSIYESDERFKSIREQVQMALGAGINPQIEELSKNLRAFCTTPIVVPEKPQNVERDKYSFHWDGDNSKTHKTKWRFTCDEFRHKIDPGKFNYYLLFDENKIEMRFKISFSASNLSAPSEVIYILHKKIKPIDTRKEILHILNYGVPRNYKQN
jgi:hypothetical protein